jgi:hypothetical protein
VQCRGGTTHVDAKTGESSRAEGEKLYGKIMVWCKTLKELMETQEFIMFCRAMIIKADEMGMLGTLGGSRKRKAVEQVEEIEAVVLEDVDFGIVAV